ncbi:MAG TPA: hypothetical protein VEO54_10430 [Thermoanaerobaculia bacterium]|nr:hypothetical protein [Thermoanaerobaculia bacterium]
MLRRIRRAEARPTSSTLPAGCALNVGRASARRHTGATTGWK